MISSPSGSIRAATPTTSERLLVMAVGGYGRGEMALHSDVDIAFVTPWKPTAWTESAIEAILYLLWDLGLKVGHSTRSVDEVIRAAGADHTIRTAILESRYVWGDEALYDEVAARFWKEVVAGIGRRLRQGEARRARGAARAGWATAATSSSPTSRKAKAACATSTPCSGSANMPIACARSTSWSRSACSRPSELRQFQRAERFLWAVRCHLHLSPAAPRSGSPSTISARSRRG